jgi:hypothetical protein
MTLKRRLNRLDKMVAEVGCPGCAIQIMHVQEEYKLADGSSVRLPELPDPPKCTCKRSRRRSDGVEVVGIVVVRPRPVASREEAERLYAEYAKAHPPWRPTGEGAASR